MGHRLYNTSCIEIKQFIPQLGNNHRLMQMCISEWQEVCTHGFHGNIQRIFAIYRPERRTSRSHRPAASPCGQAPYMKARTLHLAAMIRKLINNRDLYCTALAIIQLKVYSELPSLGQSGAPTDQRLTSVCLTGHKTPCRGPAQTRRWELRGSSDSPDSVVTSGGASAGHAGASVAHAGAGVAHAGAGVANAGCASGSSSCAGAGCAGSACTSTSRVRGRCLS